MSLDLLAVLCGWHSHRFGPESPGVAEREEVIGLHTVRHRMILNKRGLAIRRLTSGVLEFALGLAFPATRRARFATLPSQYPQVRSIPVVCQGGAFFAGVLSASKEPMQNDILFMPHLAGTRMGEIASLASRISQWQKTMSRKMLYLDAAFDCLRKPDLRYADVRLAARSAT